MVIEGIALGHKISTVRLEVDQAKVSIIENLLPPTKLKGIRSFLGHAGFYRRFIKDFSKISRPLCRLLEKEKKIQFDEKCKCSFEEINDRLIRAPIMATQLTDQNIYTKFITLLPKDYCLILGNGAIKLVD